MNASDHQRALLQRLAQLDAEGGLAALAAGGPVDEQLQVAIEAVGAVVMQDIPAAVQGARAVVMIADLCGTALGRVTARRALSRALAWGSEYTASLATAQEAVALATAADLDEEAGRAQLASMHALTEMGRLDDAATVGHDAREAFEQMGLHAMAARADINLGVVYQHLDRPERAVECLQRARAPLAGESGVLGHLENNLGESLLSMDDMVGAEVAFLDARKSFEAADSDLTAAIAEGNLADLAARRGRLGDALHWFEQARQRLVPVDAPGHLARVLAERAEVLASVGMIAASCRAFEDVLPQLDEAGLLVEAARARRGLGRAYMAAGDASHASTMLAAAATAFGDLGQLVPQAEIDLDRAKIAAGRGRTDEAFRLTHAAMARFRGRPLRETECHLVLAEASLRNDPQQAECELDAAELGARRLDVPPLLARVLHVRGRLRRSQHRLDQAAAALSEATEQVERLRGTVQADRCRAGLGLSNRAIYEDHLDVLISRGDEDSVATAFSVADRMRSRILLDQVRRGDVSHRAFESVDDNPCEQLRGRLSLLYSRLADAMDGEDIDVGSWRQDLRRAETELADAEIQQASSGGIASLDHTRVDLAAVQSQLAGGEVLLQYTVLNGEIMAFVAHADGLDLVRGLGKVGRVAEQLEALRFQIARAVGHRGASHRRLDRMIGETRGQLEELYATLMEPLPHVVHQAARLIVAPQGLLHLVPFHALHDGAQWVMQRSEVQYVPSVSLLLHLRSRSRQSADGPDLVVAGRTHGLPGVRREAEAAVAMLGDGAVLLRDADATVAAVRAAAERARVIHITGHGRFMPTHVGASGVRLDDRWLSLHEIHGLRLRADLVVLSACESGPVQACTGDEPTGLFHGFLASGARGLLATLWRVSDATSMFALASFHRHVQTGQAYATALREAQLETMQSTPHPAHWAPFIFAGANA